MVGPLQKRVHRFVFDRARVVFERRSQGNSVAVFLPERVDPDPVSFDAIRGEIESNSIEVSADTATRLDLIPQWAQHRTIVGNRLAKPRDVSATGGKNEDEQQALHGVYDTTKATESYNYRTSSGVEPSWCP